MLIQELQQIPVVLGQTGTIILGVIVFLLAVLNAIQFYKAKNIDRLNQALDTTETEMNVYKQRAERQTKELADANQQIGELKAKTDLSSVLTMLSETIALTRESVDLSRKFDRENSQTNISLVKTLEKHGQTDKVIFEEIGESLKNVAETLAGLNTNILEYRQEARAMKDDLMKAIRKQPHERS